MSIKLEKVLEYAIQDLKDSIADVDSDIESKLSDIESLEDTKHILTIKLETLQALSGEYSKESPKERLTVARLAQMSIRELNSIVKVKMAKSIRQKSVLEQYKYLISQIAHEKDLEYSYNEMVKEISKNQFTSEEA